MQGGARRERRGRGRRRLGAEVVEAATLGDGWRGLRSGAAEKSRDEWGRQGGLGQWERPGNGAGAGESGEAGGAGGPGQGVFATDGVGRVGPGCRLGFEPAVGERIRRSGEGSYVDWHDSDVKRVRAAMKQSDRSDDNELPVAVPD